MPEKPPIGNKGMSGSPPASSEDCLLDEQIRFLGDLARLDVKPDDRYVLMVPRVLTAEMHLRIQQVWRRFIGSDDPEEMKLLIIDGGMKLGVFGRNEAPPSPPRPAETEPPRWTGPKGWPPSHMPKGKGPRGNALFWKPRRSIASIVRGWFS